MSVNMSDLPQSNYSKLLKDHYFLLFLKHHIKGVFDNFFCNHNQDSLTCFYCIKEFIGYSQYKDYFEKLYNWFKQNYNHNDSSSKIVETNDHHDFYFHPVDIIKCFKSIHDYLTPEQASYFCSLWLDGMFITLNSNPTTTTNVNLTLIFETLCLNGHLETLQWLYKCKEQTINLNINQDRLFMNICKKSPQITTKTLEILCWLLSLKIFDQLDVHVNHNYAFRAACFRGSVDLVNFLLDLEGKRRINIHTENEIAFKLACAHGHLELVKFLLKLEGDRRIDVCIDNNESFQLACYYKNLDVVKHLLELEGDRRINVYTDDQRVLKMACEHGHLEVVNFLLSLEGDRKMNIYANNEEVFQLANNNGHSDIIKLLLKLKQERKN